MAATRVTYDNALIASAINQLLVGRQELARVALAIETATDAGSDTTLLEDGYFGAAAGKGAALRTQIISIKTLIDNGDSGGLATVLANLDNG